MNDMFDTPGEVNSTPNSPSISDRARNYQQENFNDIMEFYTPISPHSLEPSMTRYEYAHDLA
jgi:hypothetical protein